MRGNHGKRAFWARFFLVSAAILFLLMIGSTVWAQSTVTVSGTVKDNVAAPVAGADVLAIDAASSALVASATTDSAGYYEMNIPAGTYNFAVIVPVGSGFDNTQLLGQLIAANTTLNFVLVPSGAVTLSGRVLDGLGAGIPNQGITLSSQSGGSAVSVSTDSAGNYVCHVAPGSYGIYMIGTCPETSAAPRYYYMWTNVPISIDTDTVLDLPLPVERVVVHVQDPAGAPVAGVRLYTMGIENDSLTLGSLPARGYNHYASEPFPVTDADGNAVLWVFPTYPGAGGYAITAQPPAGSPFLTFQVQDVVVTSAITEVIVLQYAEPPTPTACPLSQGYWKNKVEHWPVDALTLGSESYSLAELLTILKTNVRADASLILAYQLIAAKANIEWGSDPAPIADVIAQSDDLLGGFNGKLPYAVRPNTKIGNKMTALAKTLESYNLKLLTPTCNPLAPTAALTQAEREIQVLKIEVEILKGTAALKRELLYELRAKLDMAILNRENLTSARLAILDFKIRVFDMIREAAIPAIQGLRLVEKADRILLRMGY